KSNTEILPNFTLYCTTYLLLMVRRSLGSTLFPYTTLFRSILLRIDKLVDRLVYLLSGWSEYKYEFQTNNHERNQQQGVFEPAQRSEEHTSELQSREKMVCRLMLEKKNSAFLKE